MKKYKIIALVISVIMVFSLCACGRQVEYVDDTGDDMPDFTYVIFPLLDQTQLTLGKIFSDIEYSNKTVDIDSAEYYFVEKSEYENEDFESQLRGVFTQEIALEYTEMIYGGESPMYKEYDGDLYVNPSMLSSFEEIQYDRSQCFLTSYNENESAVVRVIDDNDEVHTYEIKMVDGIWYLDCKFDGLSI